MKATKIKFKGVDGYDVYNPSVPFNNQKYIYGRVEKREDWAKSTTRLFQQTNEDEYTVIEEIKPLLIEDPFVTEINDQLVLGGVYVFHKQDKIDKFYTYFYKGKNINSLEYFTKGPKNMKDIRLVELDNQKIGVFTRPKSERIRKKYGSEATICFLIINNLEELNSSSINKARNIPGIFKENEWGGCNQAINLGKGKIGVIGHKSYKKKDQFIYDVISFIYDTEKNVIENFKIIASRNFFEKGPCKKDYLKEICFPAGIIFLNKKEVALYTGLNDCEVGKIIISNPFL